AVELAGVPVEYRTARTKPESRGDLTEIEWRFLKVLLPVEREPGKRRRGRPPEDNRNISNGILWRLRTAAPWRDVPVARLMGTSNYDLFSACLTTRCGTRTDFEHNLSPRRFAFVCPP